MKVLITGSEGFIGKNLHLFLAEKKELQLFLSSRNTSEVELDSYLREAEVIFHLAGVNRPKAEKEFEEGNTNSTKQIVEKLTSINKNTTIIYASSAQAGIDNPYGRSKKQAEEILCEYQKKTNARVLIYRFPNVFGKFAKPNYNSVVATFCHNISRALPIEIHDPSKVLNLVFIDDILSEFYQRLVHSTESRELYPSISPEYTTTLQELADTLYRFEKVRTSLHISSVGTNFQRALYSTFISYMPINECQYNIPSYEDPRGRFVEMLKTESSGQFSYFTAPPGITRGRHYHHTKTEKFLIIQGKALFRFQHLVTKEYYEVKVEGEKPMIVDTIPGWTHDITNIGDNELIVMLWANEVFNRDLPDTFVAEITK
ncbi:UDP-2-acetamido-2,6-beta-L-arabino-hexul-4-ose reductase [Leptospira perdikensis]|uniref:SDR family oxidoreductase n=1 Tax=Leptospira perdikensis TaxID=2484948 RepID=A0A4R9JEW8_9LEPT|nr:NAD-dependent epimerase/dehydratase family protein [Leptospira perdikensis]TGL37117.1 SDR family oxidoreductase [Leptospira perdikensis]